MLEPLARVLASSYMALCLSVRPSVCLFFCHKSVFYRNGWMNRTSFWHGSFLYYGFILYTFYHGLIRRALGLPGGSGGHTGGASGAVHQGPRPLGAHQRGPDSNFFEKLISSVSHVDSHSGYYREIVF